MTEAAVTCEGYAASFMAFISASSASSCACFSALVAHHDQCGEALVDQLLRLE
jgi:hypothetical protein